MGLPRLFYSLFFIFICFCLNGQGFIHADGKKIVDGYGNPILLRGMGLGGWMLQEGYMLQIQGIGQQQHVIKKNIEALIGKEKTTSFYDAWLANHTQKSDIDSLAAWGFNSVRLPMHYNLFTLPVEQEPIPGQQTWLTKGISMIDSLLLWCKANKIYLILDLHAAPGGQGNDLNISDRDTSFPSLWQSDENKRKTIALWRRLAEKYAEEPWIGGYDIINEPNWGFEHVTDRNGCSETGNTPLKTLMIDITRAIREVDKNHIIIVEGNCWGNNYKGILPLWDNNMVISFHKYWNNNDRNAIQSILDLREQYNAPLWLGESGENSNVWFRDAIQLVESQGIGWAWWPLKKLGYNNPFEVKVPEEYKKIIDFWAGKGPKPTPEEAEKELFLLAERLKTKNCIYHRDVTDAMFRQVYSTETLPFKTYEPGKKTTVKAVDYDLGRNHFAYFDKDTGNYYISVGGPRTSGNKGHLYRNDGVDINIDAERNYFVDHFEPEEWLQYTIQVSRPGVYSVSLLINATDGKGEAEIIVDGKSIGNIRMSSSKHAATKWRKISGPKIRLLPGTHKIKVKARDGILAFKAFTWALNETEK